MQWLQNFHSFFRRIAVWSASRSAKSVFRFVVVVHSKSMIGHSLVGFSSPKRSSAKPIFVKFLDGKHAFLGSTIQRWNRPSSAFKLPLLTIEVALLALFFCKSSPFTRSKHSFYNAKGLLLPPQSTAFTPSSAHFNAPETTLPSAFYAPVRIIRWLSAICETIKNPSFLHPKYSLMAKNARKWVVVVKKIPIRIHRPSKKIMMRKGINLVRSA